MASDPDLTIITVSHDHWSDLAAGLPTWLAPGGRHSKELIVVDNACTDGTAARVREAAPEAIVIENRRPRGFAENCNLGIARSRGRHVLLLNPDVRVEGDALDRLVDFMDEHPEAGIAGPKLLNPDGSLQLSCRRFSTPFVFALRGLGLERLLENYGPQRDALMQDWAHDEVRDVDWVLGAALIVRRSAIEAVGRLDEGFFLYCEDQDWCYRMWTRGWKVFYVPGAVMIHVHHRQSAQSLFSRWKWIHARSKLRMFRKQGISGRRPQAPPAVVSHGTG